MIGVGIFVKTPGLSPIKTRLSADVGEALAHSFYALSIDALARLFSGSSPPPRGSMDAREFSCLNRLKPYWAVAEPEAVALERWSSFPCLPQGEGGLGDRLHRVYETLLDKHGQALLIGSDLPHLSLDALAAACAALDRPDRPFVGGPAEDGGFYLFGGSRPVPHALWRSVPYSAETTWRTLNSALARLAAIEELSPDFDIDTGEDLGRLAEGLKAGALSGTLPGHLAQLAETLCASFQGMASGGLGHGRNT